MDKIKVLVIDDSALIRKILPEIIESDKNIQVVGTAIDPYFAIEKIKTLKPDVLTLDLEMPRMDGITFLEKLMTRHPMPVIVVSALTPEGGELTIKALSLGAVDFIQKPKINIQEDFKNYRDQIIEKIHLAAKTKIKPLQGFKEVPPKPKKAEETPINIQSFRLTDQVIAIGASTGGTQAIEKILMDFSPEIAGIVITQHMPEHFTTAFAQRLNNICNIAVKEAEDGDMITQGAAFIAPGNKHLEVIRSGAKYFCKLSNAEPVNRHRPSVDVLFNSVADNAGKNSIGVLLTGMGKDGAQGLLRMKEIGSTTIAENEASSIVFGMPKAAIEIGAVDHILHLSKISGYITELNDAHRKKFRLTF